MTHHVATLVRAWAVALPTLWRAWLPIFALLLSTRPAIAADGARPPNFVVILMDDIAHRLARA